MGFHERERRREAELGDDPVDEGVEGRDLGATRKVHGPLPDGDVYVGEAGFADDTHDVTGRGLGLAPHRCSEGANGTGSHLQRWALAQPMPVMAVNPR